MGYKRVLNDAEVDFLAAYSKSAEGRNILAAEIRKDILPQLKLVNGGITREVNTVYVRLHDMQKRAKAKEADAKPRVVVPATAAQKIWLEIRPTIQSALALAGKSTDYLAPLEDLLTGEAEAAELHKRIRCLEDKLAKRDQEITLLKKQRRVLKQVAAFACRGRAKLTELLTTIQKDEGVDVCALVVEIEE